METITNGILNLILEVAVALIPVAFLGLIIAILIDAFKDQFGR